MEVNITKAFNSINPCNYSASRAELGDNVGSQTWAAACNNADQLELLTTPDELQAMRDFARASGGWADDEIAVWSDTELRALFLQWIAGDMREAGLDADPIDWPAYETGCAEGRHASNIFRADDGAIYFYLGS